MTAANDPDQTRTEIIERKKKTNGTPITLLVLARKSAEASTTSMAVFNSLNLQQIAHANKRARRPKTPIPAIIRFSVFFLLLIIGCWVSLV